MSFEQDKPSETDIERLGLEKLELWVTEAERFRLMSVYYRQLTLRKENEES